MLGSQPVRNRAAAQVAALGADRSTPDTTVTSLWGHVMLIPSIGIPAIPIDPPAPPVAPVPGRTALESAATTDLA